MVQYKFNFGKFGKPKVKSSSNLPRREIIHSNIIAVICIDINGEYHADFDDKLYDLTLESFELKGKNVYYARTLQNNKTLNIISLKKCKNNNNQYLPFAVGSIVKGNVYKILGKERFNIKKILELSEIPTESYNYFKNKVHKHKQFFRDNYEEILKCMN